MGTIKLDGQSGCLATVVSNRFLDDYMPNANGEFVKIYLYLLRALSNPNADISICKIADVFNHTEKDVIRALKYWEQTGLLELGFKENKLTNIKFKPLSQDYLADNDSSIEITASSADKSDFVSVSSVSAEAVTEEVFKPLNTQEDSFNSADASGSSLPQKKTYSANEVDALRSKTDIQEIFYLAQKYIGNTLSRTDMNTVLYFYDGLGMSADLIEYLIEYCVTNNHSSFRYMEKVALDWASAGITTVSQAKTTADTYNQICYPVLKAFGISGRNPGNDEKAYIMKWSNSYGFTTDVIVEACNRTLNKTGKQSFNYADAILSKWHSKGVKNMSDVKKLDELHITEAKKNANNVNPATKIEIAKPKTSFNNFEQRNIDYAALEQELLNDF